MLEDDYFLGTSLYHKKFIELCKPIADYLGITSAMYAHVDKQGQGIILYSLKGWAERVVEKQHYKVEAGLVHPDNIHNGFSFNNASEDEEYKSTLLYDGAMSADWWHSFNYVQKSPDNKSYFSLGLATYKDNYLMMNRVLNETQIVKKLIKELNQKLQPIIQSLEDRRADLPRLKGEAFHTQKGLVFHKPTDNQQIFSLLNDLGIEEQRITKPLSPQEINCLRTYMVPGNHNMKCVARELNLAITTVASYIESIKDKLNCCTKDDLLRKASILESLGYI